MFRGVYNRKPHNGFLSVPPSFADHVNELMGGKKKLLRIFPNAEGGLYAVPVTENGDFVSADDLLLEALQEYEKTAASEIVEIDQSGRTPITSAIEKMLGEENADHAVFVGLVNVFEIWSPKRFKEIMKRDRAMFPASSRELKRLGI